MFFVYADLFSGVDFYFFNFSVFQGAFMIFSSFWVFFSYYFSYYLNFNFFFILHSFLMSLVKSSSFGQMKELKGFVVVVWSVFIFVLFSNVLGLFPYVYGITTNFYFVLFFSFWLWFSLMVSSLFKDFSSFLSHFCPEGCPLILAGFLSLIELVSVSIRPFTLTLRLVANMTTGHILIGLITLSGSYVLLFGKFFLSFLVLLFLTIYVIFELVICFVQGNVFFMLISKYSGEHS